MSRANRSYGVNDLLNRQFKTLDFSGKWRASLGNPERNFTALVQGDSGDGKTDFTVQWAKYLTNFGKVHYSSREQGMSESLKLAFQRHNMQEVAGKLTIGVDETPAMILAKMKRKNSAQFFIIDSLDFMHLTMADWEEMRAAKPNKSLIVISWSSGKYPLTSAGKAIRYASEMKIRCERKVAYIKGRYESDEPFIIWPEWVEKRALEAEAKLAAKRQPRAAPPAPKVYPARKSKPAPAPEPELPFTAPAEDTDDFDDFGLTY